MEFLLLALTLLVPVLIIFLAFKGAQILLKIQKDVDQISRELARKDV